jgi:hypothetical protein
MKLRIFFSSFILCPFYLCKTIQEVLYRESICTFTYYQPFIDNNIEFQGLQCSKFRNDYVVISNYSPLKLQFNRLFYITTLQLSDNREYQSIKVEQKKLFIFEILLNTIGKTSIFTTTWFLHLKLLRDDVNSMLIILRPLPFDETRYCVYLNTNLV